MAHAAKEDLDMLTIQSQIQDLVQEKLAGNPADSPGFVEHLLAIAGHVGVIRCSLAQKDVMRFEFGSQEPLEVALQYAKARLRTMCARLAVLCNDSGQDVNPYGGEGVIARAVVPSLAGVAGNHGVAHWHVRFKNTTDAQEFTITPVEDATPCP